MQFNIKASAMTGVLSLMGVLYLPQASAMSDLGTATPASATYFSDSNIAGGSVFSDIFSFTVGSNYQLSGSLNFTVTNDVFTQGSSTFTSSTGLNLFSVQLLNADSTGPNSLVAMAAKSNVLGSTTTTPINLGGLTITETSTPDYVTYTLNNVPITAGHYLLDIVGQGLGGSQTLDGFSGSFSVAPTTSVTPVPVSGAIWLFTGGMGLLSLISRRNQRI
jgi:hypothetical protein